MARYTTSTATEMHFDMWLRLSADGSASMSRGPASLAPGERSMKLRISVPKSIFKVPTLQASVKVPDNQSGDILTAEVQHTAEKAVRDALNLDVIVTVGGG